VAADRLHEVVESRAQERRVRIDAPPLVERKPNRSLDAAR